MKNKNNLVDFIGIGVQKSATTWMYSMLTSHPEIKGAKGGLKNKEVNFFNRSYFLGFDWYNNKFEFGDHIVGEFSTLYFPECSVPERVYKYNPDIKLILIVRNPIDRAFSQHKFQFMKNRLSDYQEETGQMYNLEATPAEGVSYRLAKVDKQKHPDIITQGKKDPYYTNSSQLPVDFTTDLFEALDLQDSLQTKYTGGTVLHGFIGEEITDTETCKQLVRKIAENYHLPYFTITPTFSICPEHGYFSGKHETCPYEEPDNNEEESGVNIISNQTDKDGGEM